MKKFQRFMKFEKKMLKITKFYINLVNTNTDNDGLLNNDNRA